jgi:hypothetical protein
MSWFKQIKAEKINTVPLLFREDLSRKSCSILVLCVHASHILCIHDLYGKCGHGNSRPTLPPHRLHSIKLYWVCRCAEEVHAFSIRPMHRCHAMVPVHSDLQTPTLPFLR